MKKRIFGALFVLMFLLAACVSRSAMPTTVEKVYEGGSGAPDYAGVEAAPPADFNTYRADAAKYNAGGAGGSTSQERMIIMTVDLTIVVVDPQTKLDAISRLANEMGGFVVSMNMYRTSLATGGTVPQGYVSIRVPSERLDAALEQIKADAVEVRNENRSGQDVTATYVDLQSQLTNLERAEQDLLIIMDEARNSPGNDVTTRTQDVLNVYNQIVNIRGQIEQIKGQMKYYEESAAYSLINVTLIAEEASRPIQIGPWTPKSEFNKSVEALVRFLQGFADFLIRLFVVILPALILTLGPVALIVWGIVAAVKRRKAKKTKKDEK